MCIVPCSSTILCIVCVSLWIAVYRSYLGALEERVLCLERPVYRSYLGALEELVLCLDRPCHGRRRRVGRDSRAPSARADRLGLGGRATAASSQAGTASELRKKACCYFECHVHYVRKHRFSPGGICCLLQWRLFPGRNLLSTLICRHLAIRDKLKLTLS